MKGVILAGGQATRLRPVSLVTNKHLLPVYDRPMIFFPLSAMKRAGIKDVLIITSPEYAGHFMRLLGSGRSWGMNLFYEIQEEAGGLSQAVGLAEGFADKDKILIILGDNIFDYNLKKSVRDFEKKRKGARVFAKEMENPSSYGVIEIDKAGKVVSIVEKPKRPKSNLVQTGIYMYDRRVFKFIKQLKPSKRGELEITDLNNVYVKEGTMSCEVLKGLWIDAGTSFDELLRANNLVSELVKAGKLSLH